MLHLPSSVLTSLLLLAPVADGWLGVYLDGERAEAVIAEVIPGSPAEKAGLQAGDELLAIDDQATPTREAFSTAVRGKKAGDRVSIKLRRNQQEQVVRVRLGERPETTAPVDPPPVAKPARPQAPAPASEAAPGAGRGYLGLAVREGEQGVEVERVVEGSPAQAAGLRAGEVITTIGDHRIAGLDDLDAAMAGRKVGQKVTLGLRSGDGARSVTVTLGRQPGDPEAAHREPAIEVAPVTPKPPGGRSTPQPPAPRSDRRPAGDVDIEAELAALRAELAELRRQLQELRKAKEPQKDEPRQDEPRRQDSPRE